MKKVIKISVALLVYALLTYLVLTGVYYNGLYPSGSDTMFHLYRGDLLYHSIQEGRWFPLLDLGWYNGVEILRYWPPLPAYLLTFCQFAAGGDIFNGYLFFVGLMSFFNAVVWLIIGISRKRIGFGAFLGALWFFMPNNLYALFEEGNLPRTICMVFLPLFFHYLYGYLHEDRKSSLPKMMICSFFMVLCHLGYAGMIFLAVILWLLIYVIMYKKFKVAFNVILGIAFSFLWTGLWAVASLKGGITNSENTAQVMAVFFQDIGITLNPFYRIKNGLSEFYFGFAAFTLAAFGVFFSRKKSVVGFLSGIIICLCTTTTMYTVISKLPGSQYLWMLRFISIALCFILFSFLLWDTLKKQYKILFCILLVLDTFPSLGFIYGNLTGEPVNERMEKFAEDTLLDRAKEATLQRMAFMDASTTGATGAYVSAAYPTKTANTFGAGWEGAATSVNIMYLNQALEDGRYLYMFDRCLEMGNDTVLIRVDQMRNKSADIEAADKAAMQVGYSLKYANEAYRLYHMDITSSFGIVSEYQALGIGSAVNDVSMVYPAIKKGVSDDLSTYSFEELSEYDIIYLDGFTCSNLSQAEELVVNLSEAGVRVVISADGVPKDEYLGTREFLGVSCYNIQFSYGYPLLYADDERWDLDLFNSGYTDWSTVYLEGLDKCLGYIEDKGETLEFLGTVENDNIIFVGLNLFYHAVLTGDESAIRLLAIATGEELVDAVPKRELVPIEITYTDNNRIIINTDYDNVNTTIAFHDNFKSEQEIWQEGNLTYVNSGRTEITMHYPYFKSGLAVSIVSIMGSAVFLFRINHKKAEEKEEEIPV